MVDSVQMQAAISAQHQQNLMQRLLSGAVVNGAATPARGIEDIAARLQRTQNGMSNGINGSDSKDGGVSVSNNTPLMHLICDDCGLLKTSSEEMEIHIKTEHLNWLPFQCPVCLTERASDAQMREHLHSTHKKNMNKFIYVDNVAAKRQLQIMMDRALSNAPPRRSSASINRLPASASMPMLAAQLAGLRNHSEEKTVDLTDSPPSEPTQTVSAPPRKRPHVEINNGDSSTDALLASISRAAASSGGIIEGELTEGADLTDMFAPKKMKHDDDLLTITHTPEEHEHDEMGLLDTLNPISVLDDVAALFAQHSAREDSFNYEKMIKNSNKVTSSQISKKRVLGECSKCNKPVTAGARQMHMFYHLAKDHGTFRFRCKFDNCNIEHYRKDQMENHHSKIHGKIDPDMMEDRSVELFQRCQELNHELFVANRSMITCNTAGSSNAQHQFFHTQPSPPQDLSMELLGTKNGSVPGPTAAKAEIAYAAQQAAIKDKEKSKNGSAGSKTAVVAPRVISEDEHPLECRLCHKTMQNRIRGFHILWHLARDMGINRYICSVCGFGHDRSQSVQTHGKKEHGIDDVVQDRINEYEDEVKEMSEKCFGFKTLFGQDAKRRSKIPMTIPSSLDISAAAEYDERSEEAADNTENEADHDTENEAGDQEHEDEDEQEEEAEEPATKTQRKRIRTARFGTRKHTPKSKREEMARLREISMILGGAQYYKKKVNESAICEKCDKVTNSRLSEHAYTHLDAPLFICPSCDLGHSSREIVARHIKDMHEEGLKPVDNRLKHAQMIKDAIKECYPAFFIDAPVPTAQVLEKLKKGSGDHIAGIESDDEDSALKIEDQSEEGEDNSSYVKDDMDDDDLDLAVPKLEPAH